MHNQQRRASVLLGIAAIFVTLLLVISSGVGDVFSVDQFTPTPEPVQPQTLESNDVKVRQEGTWTNIETANASGGSYLYNSGNASDTLAVDFTGTSLQVVYVEDPNFGSFTVEIDNNAVRTVTATGTSTVFGLTADFADLSEGTHTLRIIGIQGTVAIDAFVANDFTRPWQTYNDDYSELTYQNGNWTQETLTEAYAGSVTTTSDKGAALQLLFEGTGIEIIYTADDDGSSFVGHVDHRSPYFADGYLLTQSVDQRLTITGLEDKTHRFDLLNGNGTLRIEAIRIQGQLLESPFEDVLITTSFQTESVEPPEGECDYDPVNFVELMDAIEYANDNPNAALICLTPSGNYQDVTSNWDFAGSLTVTGFNAFPLIDSPITIEGNGAVLQGVYHPTYLRIYERFFYVESGASLTLRNLTLQNGNPYDFGLTYNDSGGAIYSRGNLTLDNVTLTQNHGLGGGGAIAIGNGGNLTITDSVIVGNDSFEGAGGGIVSYGGGTISISNSEISDNHAGEGGAISVEAISLLTINNTKIIGNQTHGLPDAPGSGIGGGIIVFDTYLSITQSSLGENAALTQGGAFYTGWSPNPDPMTISNSCIYGNSDVSFINDNPLVNLNADGNWWGSYDGPSGVGSGSGDSVSQYVSYNNFLSSPPPCPVIPPVCTAGASGFQTESTTESGYCIPQPNVNITFQMSPSSSTLIPVATHPTLNVGLTGNLLAVNSVLMIWEWDAKTVLSEWQGLQLLYVDYPLQYELGGGALTYCNWWQPSISPQTHCGSGSQPPTIAPSNYQCTAGKRCGWMHWNSASSSMQPQFQLLHSGQIDVKIIVGFISGTPVQQSFVETVPVTQMQYIQRNVTVGGETISVRDFADEKIKSLIFWVIWVESSNGRWENPMLNSQYGVDTSFLRQTPYCNDPTYPPTNFPANSSGEMGSHTWDAKVLHIYHCSPDGGTPPTDDSFAYFMAHAVLNSFLNAERGGASFVAPIFAGNYAYMNDYAGTTTNGEWWKTNAQYNQNCLRPPWYTGTEDFTYLHAFNADTAQSSYQERVRWLNGLLNCQKNSPFAPEVSQPYLRFMPQILQAIDEFFTDPTTDPLVGASLIKHVNVNGVSIVTFVNEFNSSTIQYCKFPPTQSELEDSYNDINANHRDQCNQVTIDSHIDEISAYVPLVRVIVRPQLILDISGASVALGTPVGMQWASLAFQISEDEANSPSFTRDSKNIPR